MAADDDRLVGERARRLRGRRSTFLVSIALRSIVDLVGERPALERAASAASGRRRSAFSIFASVGLAGGGEHLVGELAGDHHERDRRVSSSPPA